LKISLQYSEQMFNLTLEDNGAGFSTTLHGDNIGAGLRNMNNRAALIGAVTSIESSPGKGCCIKVTLDPFEQQLYDSSPANSIG
jgi:signal transduction histidine kinase